MNEEMIKAGNDIASDMYDVSVAMTLSPEKEKKDEENIKYFLKSQHLKSSPDNRDLIIKYLKEEIISVEAIYSAMERAKLIKEEE